MTELPPSVDALTEALLWATEWTFDTQLEAEGDRWFFDGSLREFAEALVAEWEYAQDVAKRRAAGEFGPPRDDEPSVTPSAPGPPRS